MVNIISKNGKKFNNKTLVVSVDVGMKSHMGYCRCPDGKELKAFEFFNNKISFNGFYQVIDNYRISNHLDGIVVGMESTGVYGEPLQHFLKDKPVRLVQVNPMHTKRLKELQGNSPNKTDKKDPKVIADIMELGNYLSVVIPEGITAELRSLTHARERIMQHRTRYYNQLHALVFSVYPEFLQIMRGLETKTAHYLLKHLSLPLDITVCGVKKLAAIIKKTSRGKLGNDRAEALYKSSQASVGIKEGCGSIRFEIQEVLGFIEHADDLLAKIEAKMAEGLQSVPYSRFMLSLKGIGEVTVAGLVGEFGDLTKFRTLREVLKFGGLDLYELSSGKHKGQRHISKRGRALIRKLLYFASLNTIRKDGLMHEIYQKHLKTGMKKNKALIAIARKLLAIMFALVRDHTMYIKNYNQPNLKEAA